MPQGAKGAFPERGLSRSNKCARGAPEKSRNARPDGSGHAYAARHRLALTVEGDCVTSLCATSKVAQMGAATQDVGNDKPPSGGVGRR